MQKYLEIIDQRTVLNKNFRIYGSFESPLFLAKDVAEWIEYNPNDINKMVALVDDNEKLTRTIFWAGQNREMWFLTEDGLYEILMQSRKAIAKEFKREVKVILKSIRRHGMFATDELLNDPDLAIRAFTALKQEREKTKQLALKIRENEPKVLFADSVSVSTTSILIGELAKILKQNGVNIGQNRLFSWLRENGYLINRRGTDYNMPTQKAMNLYLFTIKETSVAHSDGHVSISKTTKVTGKGQIYFIDKFLSEKTG